MSRNGDNDSRPRNFHFMFRLAKTDEDFLLCRTDPHFRVGFRSALASHNPERVLLNSFEDLQSQLSDEEDDGDALEATPTPDNARSPARAPPGAGTLPIRPAIEKPYCEPSPARRAALRSVFMDFLPSSWRNPFSTSSV